MASSSRRWALCLLALAVLATLNGAAAQDLRTVQVRCIAPRRPVLVLRIQSSETLCMYIASENQLDPGMLPQPKCTSLCLCDDHVALLFVPFGC
jgi:hypothetical protein